MATLSRSLLKHFPQEYRNFKLKSFRYKGQHHPNHNHLLGKVKGLDGIKTGFVAASGSNLAASALRTDINNKPRRLIVIVLGGPNRFWRDRRVTELFERNFRRIGIGDSQVIEVSAKAAQEADDNQAEEILNALTQMEEPIKPSEIIPASFEEEPKKPRIKAISSPLSSLRATVQFGTYPSKAEARKVARAVFQDHKTGTVLTPTFTSGHKRQYAAQITNLTGDMAEKICSGVRKDGQKCVIMESESGAGSATSSRKKSRARRA